MFNRKICRKCGTTLKKKYNFCPYCGTTLDKKEENLGMLGRNDFTDVNNFNNMRLPGGFNMLFNSILRSLEKQVKDIEKKEQEPDMKKGNISISISTMGNNAPMIKVNSIPANSGKAKKERDLKKSFDNTLSVDRTNKFSKLPKEEPKTNIRRLSNKIIYEFDLPGVKSIKDISILNLEKNMELKALSDRKAYMKSIPNFPITNFKLSKGKLTLELDAREN